MSLEIRPGKTWLLYFRKVPQQSLFTASVSVPTEIFPQRNLGQTFQWRGSVANSPMPSS